MLGSVASSRIAGWPMNGGSGYGIRNGAIGTARSSGCVCASHCTIVPPSERPSALTVMPSGRVSANAARGKVRQLIDGDVREIAREAILETMMRDARDVHVAAARVKPPRELVELLRAVGEPVEEHDGALHGLVVHVQPRQRRGQNRRIGGIARDQIADSANRFVVR